MTDLSLLTWNINQWPNPLTVARDRRRLQQVREAIADFDVVCIQECWSATAQEIRDALPHHYLDGARSRFGLGSGLLTLSRHPLRQRGHDRYRSAAVPDSLAAKGMTYVQLDLPGFGEVIVVNTHLQARRFPGVRARQMDELGRFVRDRTAGTPTVLAGDLNARIQSEEFTRLRDALDFRDAFEERPVADPDPARTRFGAGARRIDHVLLLKDTNATVEVADSGALGGSDDASDHRGLHVRLRLTR